MPANLTPTYREAEKRLRTASSSEEKLAILEEMLAIIPKHKGTDKLQADLKRRMAKLRSMSKEPTRSTSRRSDLNVDPQGAGRVCLVGPPNSGKSSILAALTDAKPSVGPYPFTTQKPSPGMMRVDDVWIQLVDLPPMVRDATPGWVGSFIRTAELILIVLSLKDDDLLDQFDDTIAELERFKIWTRPLQRERLPGDTEIPAVIVAHQYDSENDVVARELLLELALDCWEVVDCSIRREAFLERTRRRIWEKLDMIRVYTKAPGADVEFFDPVVLPRGATVGDAAYQIHRDLADRLNYAKV